MRTTHKRSNDTLRRCCRTCGKPLGSTDRRCHEHGGSSFRGVRVQKPNWPSFLYGVQTLIRQRGDAFSWLFGGDDND